MIKANIIGRTGSFGKFLAKNYFKHDPKSDIVVLAIPASAFEEVCKRHKGKTFINVCSVQYETNKICKKYSGKDKDFVGIHPLFGYRSEVTDRRCILTHNLWRNISEMFPDCDIHFMDAESHDKLMAKTHLVALEIAEKYAKHFRNIDSHLLPASVIKLREALYLLDEMPKGTVNSIKSNPFKK